jgi:hypothetical protein
MSAKLAVFNLHSTNHAKNVAKSLKRFLDAAGVPIKLSKSQALVAALYGYRNWYHLEKSIDPSRPVGPLDSELTPTEKAVRQLSQLAVLASNGIPNGVGQLLLYKISPTGGELPNQALDWHLDSEGRWQTLSHKEFQYRIYPGTHEEGLDPLGRGVSMFPLSDRTSILDRLKGQGFTAIKLCDGQPANYAVMQGQSPEEIMSSINGDWEAYRIEMHELKRLNREPLDVRGCYAGMRNLPVTKGYFIAEGLYLLETDKYDYLRVDGSILRQLPAPFRRTDVVDGEGDDWIISEMGGLICMLMPQFFTSGEVARGTKGMQECFPEAYRYLALGDQATQMDAIRAGRGFSSEQIAYNLVDVVDQKKDGSGVVLASISSFFGPGHEDEPDQAYRFDELHMFRVKNVNASDACVFQHDDHEYLGLYHTKKSEYTGDPAPTSGPKI